MLTNFWKPLIFQFAYASNLVMNSKMHGLEEQTWSTFGMLLVLDFSRFPDLCHIHIPYHSAWFFGKHCNFEYVEIAPDSRTKGSRCPALHQDGSQSELNACVPTVIVLSQGKWWYPCDGTLTHQPHIHLMVGMNWIYPLLKGSLGGLNIGYHPRSPHHFLYNHFEPRKVILKTKIRNLQPGHFGGMPGNHKTQRSGQTSK